jgi:hypothetical protein
MGFFMPLQLVRKPPVGNVRSDRLKIMLAGNHTLKQKASMLLQVKYYLQHEQRIGFAGPTDVYISLIDQYGHPLTHFFNGNAIGDWSILIENPYHCAADDYDRRPIPPVLRPF